MGYPGNESGYLLCYSGESACMLELRMKLSSCIHVFSCITVLFIPLDVLITFRKFLFSMLQWLLLLFDL